MLEWAQKHHGLASEESWPRMMAVQKKPAILDSPEELRRLLLDFIADIFKLGQLYRVNLI